MKILSNAMLAAALISLSFSSSAQSSKDSAKIAKTTQFITSQHYIFRPQDALPTGGRMRTLTAEYELQVSKDKVQSYLPYFGRAYSASIGTNESPLDFTSTDFEYTSTPNKKGDGWDIDIKCKDQKDKPSMHLTVFNNGSASLQVTSVNRQPITFNGYVEAPHEKKK